RLMFNNGSTAGKLVKGEYPDMATLEIRLVSQTSCAELLQRCQAIVVKQTRDALTAVAARCKANSKQWQDLRKRQVEAEKASADAAAAKSKVAELDNAIRAGLLRSEDVSQLEIAYEKSVANITAAERRREVLASVVQQAKASADSELRSV